MIKNSSVIFKGGKNGLLIQLDKGAAFDTIRAVLSAKLKDSKKFFGSSETPVIFQGRELSDDEEGELLAIISEHTSLTIVRPLRESERRRPISGEAAALSGEHLTRFHYGHLRSGQSVESEGSVVVTGDVNPGAEIVAGRNIVVLGALRGMAYAGRGGDASSFVAALALNPVQLRICDCVTSLPPKPGRRGTKALNPVYAYIDGGKVNIAPLVD